MQKTKTDSVLNLSSSYIWHTHTHTLCRLYDFYHCKTRTRKQQCMILISKGHNVHMLEDSKILHKTCINILQNKNCDIKRAQNMHIPLKTWFCYEMCKKTCTYPQKGNLFWDQMLKKTCTSWTQNQWFWILCRPIIYIYISKVIYVPLFEYMYFAYFWYQALNIYRF